MEFLACRKVPDPNEPGSRDDVCLLDGRPFYCAINVVLVAEIATLLR
jgi:hypothetical protein